MAIKKPGKGSRSTSEGKKPSQGSRRSSKPSMAIDKSNTPTWMKVVLIVLALVFASSFITVGASSCSQTTGTTPVATDPVGIAESKYKTSVDALNGILASEPESYTILVSLGNTYFNWAQELSSSAQTSTAAAEGASEKWVSAADTYARALEASSGTPSVKVDYAFTLFNSNQTTQAVEVASGVTKSDPTFAMAPFALGEFYRFRGDTESALIHYRKYLSLDPKNEWNNRDYVNDRIKELGGSAQ